MSNTESTVPDQHAEESPLLIHVWQADPDQEGVAVRHLEAMLHEVADDSGFVSARVLQSSDRHAVAVILEMRSVEDRQRLEHLPVVSETLRDLGGTVNLITRLFHEVASYS
ncbi:MAG TPA: hypothetical protein VHX62_06860 [Solirubrobacteraceae bacterium]|nr:hypothetical protein [Solirubrobacteraceae bacterium]